MKPFLALGILAALLLVSACGEDWDDQTDARYQCLFRSLDLKGDKEFVGNDEVSAEEQSNRFGEAFAAILQDESAFRLEPDGQFVIEYRQMPSARPDQTFDVRCSGDFNRKVITSILVDGRRFEPEPGETWDFGGVSEDLSREDVDQPGDKAPQNST